MVSFPQSVLMYTQAAIYRPQQLDLGIIHSQRAANFTLA